MNLLLDTHALIWFAEGSRCMPSRVKTALESESNALFFSIVSIWEMAIKSGLDKLVMTVKLEPNFRELLYDNGIQPVMITYQHAAAVSELPLHHRDPFAAAVSELPLHHRDPFDRLLVVQAQEERMTLVSHDSVLDQYGVRRMW